MNIFYVFIVLGFGITTVISNKFHRDLVVHTCLKYENKNVVISTLSLQFSLCKLATVAEGKAKEEIMKSLEFTNNNEPTEWYPKSKVFIEQLKKLDMIWFNKMYIDYGKILDEKFVTDSANKFGVDVEKIGFNYPKTAKEFMNRELKRMRTKGTLQCRHPLRYNFGKFNKYEEVAGKARFIYFYLNKDFITISATGCPLLNIGFLQRLPEVKAEQDTLKRITNIIEDSDINNQTCMMLITGAHIRPTWNTRFNPQRTKPTSFYRAAGMSRVNMMTRDEDVLYYDAGYYKIVTSPLEWGTSITFVLPTAVRGISGFLADLAFNPDLMKELRKYMKWRLITLTVPKFKIKTDVDMTDILNKTGITEIFQKNATFLKNMFRDKNTNENMFVSKIKEKIIIDLDEFGVIRDIDRSPFFEQQNHNLKSFSGTEFNLVLDRPFYFAINLEKSVVTGGKYDDPYHELFSGIYNGPKK